MGNGLNYTELNGTVGSCSQTFILTWGGAVAQINKNGFHLKNDYNP